MKNRSGYVVALLVGLLIGYFGGREHLKWEMRAAFQSAADGFAENLSAAFSDSPGDAGETSVRSSAVSATDDDEDEKRAEAEANAYIAEHLELYDVNATYKDAVLSGRVPGVLFKLRNNGDRSLDRVQVTVYFKDANDNIIAEERYTPVLVTEYNFSGDNQPLKAGYIWQNEKGKFYAAKRVPSEWQEGNVEARITEIRFAE